MAWTGSEAELVGSTPAPSGDEASAWEVVTDKEKALPDPTVKEEEIIDKLADDLGQVVQIADEPDFPPMVHQRISLLTTHLSQNSQMFPPPLQKTHLQPTTNLQPPTIHQPLFHQKPLTLPQLQTPMPHLLKTRMATGLSSLTPLEPLEAATDKNAPAPTPMKPTCKAAAKVALRQRAFLVDNPQPTSEDEMPPPGLASLLRTTKPKSAAKRAPSVSAAKRSGNAPLTMKRPQSASRSRSHGKKAKVDKGSGPIRPLSPKVADKNTGPIKPPCHHSRQATVTAGEEKATIGAPPCLCSQGRELEGSEAPFPPEHL